MRINHNIAAMNTYNKLSSNNSATAKSLEKLSSGLKINRAGDNAAGLAISEKMRAQIRGLDQASTNASDAISMIQTAEGSLSETHSILQRMKELATQSANDTNTTSDRAEIQKEINQLSSEINRIGNATEFNTQKLLNGGTQIKTNANASAAALSGGQVNANSLASSSGVGGTDAVAAKWNSGNITASVANNDTFTFGGVTIAMNVAAADATHVAGAATLAAGFTGTSATLNMVTGDPSLTSATAVRTGILAALNAAKGVGGSPIANITFGTSGTSGITATDTKAAGATNNAFAFVATGGSSIANVGAAAQEAAGVGGAAGVTGVAATSIMTFTGVAAEGSSIIMADQKISFWNSANTNFANAAEAKEALAADFVVDVNPLGLTSADATGMAAKVVSTVGASGIGGFTMSSAAGVVTATANSTGVYGGHNRGQVLDITSGSVNASGAITLTDVPAEGSNIAIGGQKIGFYDSSLATYASNAEAKAGMETEFAVDTKGLSKAEIADAVVALQTDINNVLTKDVTLSKTVNTDGSVAINVAAQTAGFGGNTISLDVSDDRTSGFKATFQIGANTAQSMTFEASDMRSQALSVTGNVAGETVTAENGTVAHYVSTANVTDGTTNSNIEYALDVSSHDKATAAISVLSDAISKVSAERSKYGAYQNRLEHTITNLGTSSENLTAAESRIRDVDMAKEMMEFQKNNILSQAATSMLAQANQQPQSVLQLLQ